MKRYILLMLAPLLIWAGCNKEPNETTDFTKNYPGTYVVAGTRQVFPQDTILVSPVSDTVYVSKVDNNTLAFNGVELTYATTGTGGSLFERHEVLTYYQLVFVDAFPDSLYYLSSHSDGIGGGYSLNLRGCRINP